MQSAALLLTHLGERTAAERLETAIHDVYGEYREARYVTPDVGGAASTADFTDAVIRHLELPAAAQVSLGRDSMKLMKYGAAVEFTLDSSFRCRLPEVWGCRYCSF